MPHNKIAGGLATLFLGSYFYGLWQRGERVQEEGVAAALGAALVMWAGAAVLLEVKRATEKGS